MGKRSRILGSRARGKALAVLPSIPDAAPAEVKDGLAIRNACVTEGRCPVCGVRATVELDRAGMGWLTFGHVDGCPVLRDDDADALERGAT